MTVERFDGDDNFPIENNVCADVALAGAQTCTFDVRFAAQTVGISTTRISILTDEATGPLLMLTAEGSR